MFHQGIVSGVIGMAVLVLDLLIWRRMEGKAPIRLSGKTVASVAVGVIGALLMLIPMTKGLHD